MIIIFSNLTNQYFFSIFISPHLVATLWTPQSLYRSTVNFPMFLRPYDPEAPKQRWTISGEHIHLVDNDQFVFDVQKRRTYRGANVLGFRANGQHNQRWYIRDCSKKLPSKEIEAECMKLSVASFTSLGANGAVAFY